MSEPRDVAIVCMQILKIIPETEIELLNDLRNFQETLWNQAPELRKAANFWKPFIHLLNNNITNIDNEWKLKVLKIINN
jgi:hypothetical protein|uniref:Uncharacterized protein n=1 Tax=viral metagenome TaxID=1070528 RepID=A0A6C0JM11_9ZZZZ